MDENSEHGQKLAEQQYNYEIQPENFLRYLFEYDYKDIKEFRNSQFEYYETDNYMSRVISSDVAYKLYQAVQKDAQAGVLQKYNTVDFANGDEQPEYQTASLNLSYKHSSKAWADMYLRESGEIRYYEHENEDSMQEGYAYISFGSDCRNILQALFENGLIDSLDQPIFHANGLG